MGVRTYVPSLGRFLQVDPVLGGSANAYEYAFQDPINMFDLDGRLPRWLREVQKRIIKITTGVARATKKAVSVAAKQVKALILRGALKAGLKYAPAACFGWRVSEQFSRSGHVLSVRSLSMTLFSCAPFGFWVKT